MYGLKQAGIISHQNLIKHLTPYIYHLVKYTTNHWKHDTTHPILFLGVDEFSIKYNYLENAHHLLNAFKTKYTISDDWKSQL